MRSQGACPRIFLIILGFSALPMASCSGMFELRLLSLFHGSKGEFRPELRLCLKHFERRINHKGACTFGEMTIGAQKLRNGTKIHFDFAWPQSFTLITEVWRSRGSLKDLVFHEGFQRESIPSSDEWHEETLSGSEGFRMKVAYRVVCDAGYYGPTCSTFCKPISDTIGHFECSSNGTLTCKPGWTGKDCDIAQCSGCVNGFCERPGLCRCKSGWTGASCDQCVRYPGCKHGTCNQPNECICDQGWGGHFCSEDLNYCTRHRPCKNGAMCSNTGHGQFTCECTEGYSGVNCEVKIRGCSTQPCLNGATCVESENNYTCQCARGYSGRNCQQKVTSCADDPCRNGASCNDIAGGGFSCSCISGWNGHNCDTRSGPCQQRPCANGGKCLENGDNYECICTIGFVGKNCEANAKDCPVENPCLNGGRCIDEVNNYKCQCPEGFSGTLCQDSVNACLMEPCSNGARCMDLPGGGYLCKCSRGFRGTNCDIEINECDTNPCRNGGTCVNVFGGYQCECPDCAYGHNCAMVEPRCSAVQYEPTLNKDAAIMAKPQSLPDMTKPERGGLSTAEIAAFVTVIFCIAMMLGLCLIAYRKKWIHFGFGDSASAQNDANSRRLSRYSEQKQCLAVCTTLQNDINYYQQPYKAELTPPEKTRPTRYLREEKEYGQRYADEPTNRCLPSSNCTTFLGSLPGADKMRLRHMSYSSVPPKLPNTSTESDSVYEEIDSTPPESVQPGPVNDSDSGIVSPEPNPIERNVRQPDREVNDLQTNFAILRGVRFLKGDRFSQFIRMIKDLDKS